MVYSIVAPSIVWITQESETEHKVSAGLGLDPFLGPRPGQDPVDQGARGEGRGPRPTAQAGSMLILATFFFVAWSSGSPEYGSPGSPYSA